MPGLVRKLVIFAAIDGLVLQPLGQRPAPPVQIKYKDNIITPALKDGEDQGSVGKSFEAFGIVGLLTVSKSSFLISITKRQQVAQIHGKPIYVITGVALTPLSSQAAADSSIANTQTTLQKRADLGSDESDTDDEEAALSAAASDDVDDDIHPELAEATPPTTEHKRTSSVAEDVISRKGGYGRFAQKWFSRKGWTVDSRRNLGMADSESGTSTPDVKEASQPEPSPKDVPVSKSGKVIETAITNPEAHDVAASLLPKLLYYSQMLFASSNFFYSYDYDVTRSLATQQRSNSELPLHKQVDPLFFWNRHLISPFIDASQTSFVLPLMQGFIGQKTFEMDSDPPPLDGIEKASMELEDMSPRQSSSDETGDSNSPRFSGGRKTLKPFLITLISRRSVKRAGLRYLRRGIDEDGHTANGVETEQILSDPSWSATHKIYSFVQIRGSIPVFFSQSPYSFKPIPQLQHSEEFNYRAFQNHLSQLTNIYGSVQLANLVEKHGAEAIVGEQFEKFATRLIESDGAIGKQVAFEWFDFHAACRGMKFENISLLLDIIGKKLDRFGYTVELESKQIAKQQGVLRTNCMDCLDRTNVLQSACGRRALEIQLKEEGIDISIQHDQVLSWFNTLWADNGDAISSQYASTAAMKGDFTRTRKRNFQGALKDMGISISRFYSGIVNDFFSQAAIDFLLGNVTSTVFEDFEANLMSVDPGTSMQKLRQQAIETCQKIVVADDHEEMIGGWTLLTPQIPNTIKSSPFEESVLLLTDVGLYSCRFDWNTEKVSSFERIDLQHITSIKYGTYITSTLSAAQGDELRNVGIVITYKAGEDDITRVNTRSMSNAPRGDTDLLGGTSIVSQPASALQNLLGRPTAPATKVLALKALPSKSAVANNTESQLTEIQQVKGICTEIERMILHGQVIEAGTERKSLVKSGDIISLADARKNTGLLSQLQHQLKKLVWA
ncbi:hypothetical protein BDZ45DRAFT_583437 [Acephala macrosclerotiorum]|nr:hypothetical protein BDZ45DRAFT_583437 [Acephala macrosclerotiorum]